jgi:hypothetical protein
LQNHDTNELAAVEKTMIDLPIGMLIGYNKPITFHSLPLLETVLFLLGH